MSCCVFEFGSEKPEPVLTAIESTWRILLSKVIVMPADREDDLSFLETDLTWEDARSQLLNGAFSSISGSSSTDDLVVLVYKPGFASSRFRIWSATAEVHGALSRTGALDPFLSVDGLAYISISLEDTIVLDLEGVEVVTAENFPWSHWRLAEAAVRRPDMSWDRRQGPAFSALQARESS